ncbi:MAG: TonB-dependent receptor, partial [Saprospiraceae bacterium]|nr:TonB-dependent receptor [Saprospiraceae bacterium]
SAFEVLERAPGVFINANDNISIRGKSGVIVMIDGKPTPMSGQELANMLRGMPSGNIERIDIITNPSAKYDAAGNAGIIDIRLKKDKNLGTNGTLSANYGQGVYHKAGAGLNLNHRNRHINAFGNYNYSLRKGFNKLDLIRTFYENGQSTGAYDQRNYVVFPFRYHSARAGLDISPNPNTIIGIVASASLNEFDPNGQNHSNVLDSESKKISAFTTGNDSHDHWPTYTLNANLKQQLNDKGRELSADLDYMRFWNQTNQNFTTDYLDLNGQPFLPTYLLVGELAGNLQIRSLKADYVNPLKNNAKWEAGIKTSLVTADNNVQFFDNSDPAAPLFDSTKSNHFLYRENLNAAYLNGSKEWEKASLQLGLRAEQTRVEGDQLVTGQQFDTAYLNLFPSAFFNLKIAKNYESGLNVSRRLDRPSYQQLNPFKFFLDPSTYREGNPYLRPQFTWSYEWVHTFYQKYSATLAYSRTNNNITQVIVPVDGLDRITVQTDKNLARYDYYSLSIHAPIEIAKWWSCMNDLNIYHGNYTGTLANTNLADGNTVLFLNINNNFRLKNDWSAEIGGYYQSRQVYAFMNLDPLWSLNLGVQKQLFARRATLRFNVSDVFWTSPPSAVITFRDYVEHFDVKRETRVASLSLSWRFGNNQVAPTRRRSSGAEDERRRASQGQG